jgi:hypothetical protein
VKQKKQLIINEQHRKVVIEIGAFLIDALELSGPRLDDLCGQVKS